MWEHGDHGKLIRGLSYDCWAGDSEIDWGESCSAAAIHVLRCRAEVGLKYSADRVRMRSESDAVLVGEIDRVKSLCRWLRRQRVPKQAWHARVLEYMEAVEELHADRLKLHRRLRAMFPGWRFD